VDEVLADQRRSEQHRLERAEACERSGLLRAQVLRIRQAAGVRRREAEIHRHAAHYDEGRMRVQVDEARRDHPSRQTQLASRALRSLAVRTDPLDPVCGHCDRGIAQHRRIRLGGENGHFSQEQIDVHAVRR
jgi:hypothetical protein